MFSVPLNKKFPLSLWILTACASRASVYTNAIFASQNACSFPKRIGIESSVTFVLSGLLLFLFAPVVCKKHFYVFLRLHQFLQPLSCFPIARIFCFFLFQKLNIFDTQFFYLRKFFSPASSKAALAALCNAMLSRFASKNRLLYPAFR